jgi:hypothetical protein
MNKKMRQKILDDYMTVLFMSAISYYWIRVRVMVRLIITVTSNWTARGFTFSLSRAV